MPKDMTDPAVLVFLKEAYDRESRLRCQWIFKHREKLELATTLHREPTNYYERDVIAQNMVGGIPAITRDFLVAAGYRRKVPLRDAATMRCAKDIRHENSIITMGLGDPKEDPRLARSDTDLSLDPVMRPIDPKLKKIIYKPRPKFGRELYLKKRADIWPEKKYYFPECSNWDYGWRIADSGEQRRARYGRCWLLNRTLRSRVGPQPDPTHYNSADIPSDTKCVPY